MRDNIHSRDLVNAFFHFYETPRCGEVYNIGGVETMKVGEMLNRLLGLSSVKNIKIEIDPNRLRPSDVTLQIPSTNKFFKETGWKPEIKFEQTIKDTLNYWREYYRKERG